MNGDLLAQRTEAELMGLMAAQRRAPTLARDAWAELYQRHSRYVAAVIVRSFGNRPRDAETLSDIVSDTFRTVFDWAGRQNSGEDLANRFSASDRDVVRRKVLGFHAVVARRLAAHRFASEMRGQMQFLSSNMEGPAASTNEDSESTGSFTINDMLDLLSLEEAEALRLSLPWYEPQTGEFALPRGEAARIASTLGTTPDAFRQRRHRSLKKLQALLHDELRHEGQ